MASPNNKSTKSNKNYSNSKSKNMPVQSNKLYLLPIIFIVLLLPLIVRIKEINNPLNQFTWYASSTEYVEADEFLYYKQIALILISIFMIILIVAKAYKNRKTIKFAPIFIPVAAYATFALLSAIFSKYIKYCFTGISFQYESVLALLGYCLIIYYIYLFVNTELDVKYIIKYFTIGICIMGLIGLSQYIGHDFFGSNIGKRLISPKSYWNSLDAIGSVFEEKRVYLSLYNPNYVGVYVSLIAPMLLFLFLFNKNIKMKLLYAAAFLLMIISLIGSQSKTGIIAVIFTLFLGLLFLWRYIKKYYKITIPVILIAIISFTIFISINRTTVMNQLSVITKIKKSTVALNDIQTKDNEVQVTYNNNNLHIQYVPNDQGYPTFQLYDDSFTQVSANIAENNSYVVLTDERFPGIVIQPDSSYGFNGFVVTIDSYRWLFTNQVGDGSYYYLNNSNKLDKMKKAPSAVFTGYEQYASGRGYIWSRTIPLLKDHILLGSGPDTFSIEFPQQDYVSLHNYGYSGQVITKPHNLYMQIGVQTGVLSLIAFLVFYIIYFISSFRLYIKGRFDSYLSQIGVSIFLGSIAYMICGLSNDSSITVAPLFWVFIGLGIVINTKVKQSNNNESAIVKH